MEKKLQRTHTHKGLVTRNNAMFAHIAIAHLAIVLPVHLIAQVECLEPDHYIAAIYEHALNFSGPNNATATRQEALSIMMNNLMEFEKQAQIASSQVDFNFMHSNLNCFLKEGF